MSVGLSAYTLHCLGPYQTPWIYSILQLFKSHQVNIRQLVWIESFQVLQDARLELRFELSSESASFIGLLEQFLQQFPELSHCLVIL